MKQLENELENIEKPKGHYETIQEFTKDVIDYDEKGNQIGTHKEITGKSVKWVWDKDTTESKLERIRELKKLLRDSDYRAIKYSEGLYTDEEYEPYRKQRQEWRDEINDLEEQLNKLYQ